MSRNICIKYMDFQNLPLKPHHSQMCIKKSRFYYLFILPANSPSNNQNVYYPFSSIALALVR